MTELVGREDEVTTFSRMFESVEQGRAHAVVLEGVAGVGKTTLLDHVSAMASERGWTVVRTAGTEFEQELAFTGLASIVGPHLDVVDRLDARYANALRAALAVDEGSTPALAVGIAFLTFLATMAEQHPVLVVVDDLHWLDQASAGALHFAINRLDADAVGVIMGSRPEVLPPPARSLPSVELEELDEGEIIELLGPLGVSAEVARRCAGAMGGNPLGLLELARHLSQDQRAGREELPDPLPLAQRLADAFQPLLDALAPPTRKALEVAAIAGTNGLVTINAALDHLAIDRDELVIAEEAGLIELGPDGLFWTHPLARASVQHNTTRANRRAAHRALADVLDPARSADQIAWHLAAAATGPDAGLAQRLEDVGEAARRRGALGAAAQAFARAAQLSEANEDRAERLRLTGQALWAGGTSLESANLMYEAVALSDDPVARARIVVTLGEAEMWSRGMSSAIEVFEKHARLLREIDPALSAHLHVRAAGALIVAGDIAQALSYADAADEAAQASGDPATMFAAGTVRTVARLLAGEPGAVEALEPITTLTLALLPGGEGGIEMAAQLAGFAACVTESWDEAEQLIGGVIRIGEELGMLGLMAVATVVRADARFRSGRWTEALTDLTTVLNVIESTEEQVAIDFCAAHLARVEAARGLEEPCRRHADAAIATGTRLGIGSVAVWGRHSLAVLELGAGRPEHAVEHLDAISLDMRAWGVGEPGVLWWQADHVVALAACGRTDEAATASDELARQAEATGRPFAVAAAAWCRALLSGAGTSEEDESFAAAITGFEAVGAPFERGRVLLERGRRRVRGGKERVEGRRDLAEARSVFDRLGARAWAEQARAALGDSSHEQPILATTLTPAELRVALAVGAGASNREAADQLFVSLKTVDFHLQNIYKKLDIRSRAQLAAIVAKETAVTG